MYRQIKNLAFAIGILSTIVCCTAEQKGNLSNIFMNKSSFNKLVERFENEERNEWQKPEQIIDLLGDLKGKKIVDIGAGTGYFSFRLANRGAEVIAADVDQRFIDYINNRISDTLPENITTRIVEYEDPLLAAQEVDHAIVVNTYHHIDNREAYFSKVLKGINPNGSLMIVDFKKDKKSPGPPKRYRISTKKATEELKAAGFKTFEVNTELLENQYIILAYP